MPQVYSTATLGLRINAQQFNNTLSDTGRVTQNTLDKMKLSADAFGDRWQHLTDGIKDTKRIISGILISQGFYTLFGALTEGSFAIAKFSTDMETAGISMEYFVEGANKAAKATAFLRELNTFAAETPFNTEEAISMSKYMQAVGISMNTTKSVLGVITDAAAATGATDENLQRIVFALGQMKTKGRIANEEIRQLANANIPIYKILQEELGLTGTQISNIGKYWVDADDAIVAIMNGLEKRYDGAAERISNTVTGMLDTLSDNSKIISQHAFSGVYDAASNVLTQVRDLTDRYREVVTEQGSMGLFDTIINDIDSSGEIGTSIIATIGNVRQLGTAVRDLYTAAQPLIGLFGKSIFASVNVATITLTSFARVADAVVIDMQKLGITTGSTAQVLSSLFITYKAATWMGALGQGAMSAAYSLYQTASATSAILPASIRANAGVSLLTAGLAGLVSYGLAAYGIFKMLNNASAGLDTSSSTGGAYPDDYSAAMDEYEAEMAAYNEAIAKYQESFNSPYTAISDGSEDAVSGLADVAAASKKASGSVKKDWTAAFDEVYSIPDAADGGGSTGKVPTPPDLGSFLTLPRIVLPAIDDLMPKMPEFDWNEVYEGSPFDSDVFNADWWSSLLPIVIAGGAIKLGSIMAHNRQLDKDGTTKFGTKITDALYNDAATNTLALKALDSGFNETESLLRKIQAQLNDPTASKELRIALENDLDRLITIGKQQLAKRNVVSDAMLTPQRTSTVLDQSMQYDALAKILNKVSILEESQGRLLDEAYAMTSAGNKTKETVENMQRTLTRDFGKYIKSYGNDEGIENLLKTFNVNIMSVNEALDKLYSGLDTLSDLTKDATISNIELANKTYKQVQTAVDFLAAAPIADKAFISDLSTKIDMLGKTIASDSATATKTELLYIVNGIQKNGEALRIMGEDMSTVGTILNDTEALIRKGLAEAQKEAAMYRLLAKYSDESAMETAKALQEQLNANKAFRQLVEGPIGRQLGGIMGELSVIKTAGTENLRQFSAGVNVLNGVHKKVTDLLSSKAMDDVASFKPLLQIIAGHTSELNNSNGEMQLELRKLSDMIDSGIQEIASNTKADGIAVDAWHAVYDKAAESGATAINKAIKNGIEVVAAAKSPYAGKVATGSTATPEQIFGDKVMAKFKQALFDKKGLRKLEDVLQDTFKDIMADVHKLAIEDNWPETSLDKTKFSVSRRAQNLITENREHLTNEYNTYYATKSVKTDGISQTDLEKAANRIGADIKDIPAEMADVFGTGTRTAAIDKMDALLAANKGTAAKLDAIVKGGIFKYHPAITGSDVGPASKGISGFGSTSVSVLRNDVTDDFASMFKGYNDTIVNMIPKTIGIEAEYGFGRVVAAELAKVGENVYKASTYISKDLKMIAQLDTLSGIDATHAIPMDLKLLNAEKLNVMKALVSGYGEISGNIIKLTAEGVRRLSLDARDYVLQATQQGLVTGKNTVRLAVGDRSNTLDPFVKRNVLDKIDITANGGIKQFTGVVREGVKEAFDDANTVAKLAKSITIFEWKILKEDRALLEKLSDSFIDFKDTLTKKYVDKILSKDDVVEILQPRLSSGQALADSYYRFIGENYKFEPKGVPTTVTEIVNEQTPMLRSGDYTNSAVARQRLLNVADSLYDAVKRAPKALKDAGEELIAIIPAFDSGSAFKEVKGTADKLLLAVNRLHDFVDVYKGYDLSAVTQFNDKFNQIKLLAGLRTPSSAIINPKAPIAKQVSFKELIEQAGAMAKNLEKIYNVTEKKISTSLIQMAAQGTVGNLDYNPFAVMNMFELNSFLQTAESGLKEGRLAIEGMVSELVVKEKLAAEAMYALSKEIAKPVDKVDTVLTKEIAKSLESAATEEQMAAVRLTKSADETMRAASENLKAAKRTAEAAETLNSAAKVYSHTADTDTLLNLFKNTSFNPEMLYTVYRGEGAGNAASNATMTGSKLQAMQDSGRAGFETATIYDQAGKLVYAPIEDFGDKLPNFISAIDDILKKLAKSGLNGADILSMASNMSDAFYEAVKRAAVQVDLTDALQGILGGTDRGTIASAVDASMDSIVKAFNEGGTVEQAAKTVLENLGGADTAGQISDDIAKAISGIFTKNESLLKTASGDALGKAIEEALSSTDAIDTDELLAAYSRLNENFIKNLDAEGIKLGSKANKAVSKYFDKLLGSDGGLGIAADDIATYLKSATKELGWKALRKNTEAIDTALSSTVDDFANSIKTWKDTVTPKLGVSDDVLDIAESILKQSADDLAEGTAKSVAGGLSKFVSGGTLANVGLNVLGVALEGYFDVGEQKAKNESLTESLKMLSGTDANLAGALKVLQDNDVDIATILKSGNSNLFSAMLGKGDLSNSVYESVGAEAGATAVGLGAQAGLVGLGMGTGPAGWIAAGIGIAASAGYQFGGGKTALNQDTDAYMEALKDDTFYKNAKDQGMSDTQARAMADALTDLVAQKIYNSKPGILFGYGDKQTNLYGSIPAANHLAGDSEEAIQNRILRMKQAIGDAPSGTVDYTDTYFMQQEGFKNLQEYSEELKKHGKSLTALDLYQTENLKAEKELLDAIFIQGDYSSDMATTKLGMMTQEEIDYLGTTKEYGKAIDVYENIDEFIELLNQLGTVNENYQQLLDSGKLEYIVQAANEFVAQYQTSISNMLDVLKNTNGDKVSIERVATWNSSDADKTDDKAGQTLYETYSNFNDTLAQKLAEEYGITITAAMKEVTTASGDVLKELYTSTAVDISKAAKEAIGWTIKTPDNITIDSASLSASDVEVLAAAGIQINGDGTITFMKAMNENITGTEREANITAADLAKAVTDALATSGISITGGEEKSSVAFDTPTVSKNMSGAMFQTSLDAASEVSEYQSTVLASLGKVLESGFIEITNKAVLSGKMTITQYLASMGTSIDALSPEIKEELARIDEVIAQGGVASAEAIATWSDGIVIPSPIDEEELTAEMKAAFAAIGVTFTTEGDEFVMVVNRLGNQLKDGSTLIPTEMWDSLNESVKMNLKALGVTWETEAGYTKVNISNTLGAMIDVASVDASITGAMQKLGLAFTEEAGVITGVTDKWGKDITDGMYKIPSYLESTLTPAVRTAMQSLGIVITETEEGTVLDMNNIMSKGIGDLVTLFTEQPEFWNQIPEAIKQTMINAGYVTADGLLQINASTLTGLQQIGDDWVGFWQNMPNDTKRAFTNAGINTKEGCFEISKYLDESSIPDGVDYLIQKFDELPPEMQDAITKTGEAINANGYIVYNATAAMVGNMENAIIDGKSGAVEAAETMAQEVGNAMAGVMRQMQQFEQAQQRAKAGFLGFSNGRTVGTGKELYGIGGSYTYYPMYNAKGESDGYIVYNNATGANKQFKTLKDVQAFAKGGTVGPDLPTLAGEYGSEMAIFPDGHIEMLGGSRGVLADLPEGTRILNAGDTQEILKYTGPIDSIKKYGSGNTKVEAGKTNQYSLKLNSETLPAFKLEQEDWNKMSEAVVDKTQSAFISGEDTWNGKREVQQLPSYILQQDGTEGWTELPYLISSEVNASGRFGSNAWITYLTANTLPSMLLNSGSWGQLSPSMSGAVTSAGNTAVSGWQAYVQSNPLRSLGFSADSWKAFTESAAKYMQGVIAALQAVLDKAELKAKISLSGGLSIGGGSDASVYGSEQGAGFAQHFLEGVGYISSGFGMRTMADGSRKMHHGVDIAANMGAPIKAAIDGTVKRGSDPKGYGNYVDVVAEDGTYTRMGHMSAFNAAFPAGTKVKAGNIVGYVGSTGNSTGPHIHAEYHPGGGAAVDPKGYFFQDGGVADGLSVVAEAGREIAVLPDGTIQVLDKPWLYDLPNGTQIINNEDTEKILGYTGNLQGAQVKAFADGNTTVAVDATVEDFEDLVLKHLALLVQYNTPVEADASSQETFSWLAINLNQAIRGAVAAITEFLTADSNADSGILVTFKNDVVTRLDTAKTDIISALSKVESSIRNISLSSNRYESDSTTGSNKNLSKEQLELIAKNIADAKTAYEKAEAADDKEGMVNAHNTAEIARGLAGYSGGDDGSQNIGGAQDVVDAVNTLVTTLKTGVTGSTATVNGTVVISDGGAYDPTTGVGLKPINGSASGSLVTKDALYRAGEFGLNEAIVPLEQPSIMRKVGATIADYIPESSGPVINIGLTSENIANIAAAICGPLLNDKPAFIENFAQSIRGAVAAITELSTKQATNQTADIAKVSKDVVDKLGTVSTDLLKAVADNATSVSSAVKSMRTGNTDTELASGTSWQDTVAEAQAEYAAATTDAAKEAAHAKAEAARGTVGLTGGDDGSVLSKIKGSARGSMITKDSLYRAGEFGLNEAIIPLERPGIMRQVGAAIASFMPTEYNDDLAYARTLQNAGVQAPKQVSAYDQQAQMMSMIDGMAQRVLETVLPAMSYANDDESKTPVYVGTLIADDAGLKQLEKKLYVIRQSEESRRK
jgi:tape measure domain-containing protein